MSRDVTPTDPEPDDESHGLSVSSAKIAVDTTAADGPSPRGRGASSHTSTIWLEVEDFVRYFDHFPQISGIQRVCLEIFAEIERQYGATGRVGFCRLNLLTQEFERVEFSTILEKYLRPPGADAPWHALALLGERRAKLASVVKASRRLPRYLRRSILPSLSEWVGRRCRRARGADFLRRGDIVVCLGTWWINQHYSRSIEAAKRDYGVRFAMLIHDAIPLLRPDLLPFFARQFVPRWVKRVIASADVILTVSSYSRGDIVEFAARHGLRLPITEVLPLGTGFETRRSQAESGASGGAERLPSRFVLYVSTIEHRKNHRLLVEVWRRLVARHGVAAVPDLVFIGRPGYVIVDFLDFRSELMASGCVDGKLHILSNLSDAELAEAYRRCLFTVFPSLYEGWGLPVAESLAHGKFCVASDRTSLPEVGGSFADYFDPDDIEDVVLKIERPMFDPAYLAAREARLRAEYRPNSWADCAHALIAALDRTTGSPKVGRPPAATPAKWPAAFRDNRGLEALEP